MKYFDKSPIQFKLEWSGLDTLYKGLKSLKEGQTLLIERKEWKIKTPPNKILSTQKTCCINYGYYKTVPEKREVWIKDYITKSAPEGWYFKLKDEKN